MTSIQNYCLEKNLPAFIVVIMLKMGFENTHQFTNMKSRGRDQILKEFAKQIKTIAADNNHSFHKIIKDHLTLSNGSFVYDDYVAPLAVKLMLDGNFF